MHTCALIRSGDPSPYINTLHLVQCTCDVCTNVCTIMVYSMLHTYVSVQVGVVSDAVTVTGSVHNYPAIPECDLGSNLGNLLESGSYSDVTLAVGDKEFKAHKAILAGRWLTQ